jgi:predicted component of type VI protein secretion system
MAKLVVLTQAFAGRSCELTAERTTIGRMEDNNFPIAEPSVSSHHCEILLRDNQVVVRDLNSTNGTFINGEPVIKETVLRPGQTLRLGSVELRLENGAPPPAPAKKQLDHAAPGPAGVKMGDLARGSKPTDPAFAKKSDQTGKLFIYGGVALGLLIVGAIGYAILQLSNR